jgi:hypothetical protein
MWVIGMPSRCFKVPYTGHLLSICCATFALLAVVALHAREAEAQYTVINNGLAPPNPDNVIDSSDPDLLTYVRNVGCPPGGSLYHEPCPAPGAPTHVEIVDGASVTQGSCTSGDPSLENAARDTSRVTMSGGTNVCLTARDNARIDISGGSLGNVYAYDQSAIAFEGGTLSGYLLVRNDATAKITGGSLVSVSTSSSVPMLVTGGSPVRLLASPPGSHIVEGTNFEIDGVPVAYGEYTIYGNLSGTWASGDTFYIGEVSSDQVTLRPPTPAVPALPLLPTLALAATLLAIGAAQIRRQRTAQG